MAVNAKKDNIEFGVGDTIQVTQKVVEGGKERLQTFEGIVIGIKGRGESKTFTVRRIGVQKIGIERIFPLSSPVIENIVVVKEGSKGVRRAKLYYIRDKSRKEIEKIYTRNKRERVNKKSKKTKRAKTKKTSKR
ncbi:50S ribosomal protein L19 [Patescibacteria group bacterium]